MVRSEIRRNTVPHIVFVGDLDIESPQGSGEEQAD
jgi:hypothetical protein